jgi:hypothetical protein
MDRTGDQQVKQNKPDLERQILHIFSHMKNLDLKKQNDKNEKERLFGRGKAAAMCERRG